MQTAAPDVPVVILTGHGNVASAVECLKAGASDYILKPAEPEALEVALDRALEGARPAARGALPAQRGGRPGRGGDRGERALAARDGDGRGRRRRPTPWSSSPASRAPARSSWPGGCTRSRAAPPGPFVKVNCAAVPLEMWESEFFGHRKGSFAGRRDRPRGPLPARRPGHAAARRGGGDAGGRAGQAPARDPGRRVRAPGRRAGDPRRRARGRLHQQRPRGGGAAGPVPRGPLLPPQRRAHRRAARCASAGTTSRSSPATSPTRSRSASAGPPPSSCRRRSPASRPTPGRATSASCAT